MNAPVKLIVAVKFVVLLIWPAIVHVMVPETPESVVVPAPENGRGMINGCVKDTPPIGTVAVEIGVWMSASISNSPGESRRVCRAISGKVKILQ